MNCEQVRAALLAEESTASTDAHLDECPSCRSRRPAMAIGRDILADPSVWEEPAPELGDRIVSLLSQEPTTAVSTIRNRQRWMWLAAAAAAVLVVIGVVATIGAERPDWEVAMPGTDLAPAATSTVAGWNTDSGTRMRLTVSGLPPAPTGTVYELWLSAGALHVSAGTFTSGGDIEVWTGVRRSEFPRLWVTIEPLDEDESPSGRTVLDTG
jgi:hypothetical protein